MNIYEQLGARPSTGFDCLDKAPYVWSDGSTNEQTKAWAIQKLGFNDPRIQYSAWIERGDKSNVVPHSVEISGVKCYLSPRSIPGYFDMKWARIGLEGFWLTILKPDDLYEALIEAQQKGQKLLEYMHQHYIMTDSAPHYDDRFEWHESSSPGAQDYHWSCNGKEVEHIKFWVCIPFEGSFWRIV